MTQLTVNVSGFSEYPRRCRMLVAGPAGSGKTHFGTLMPNPIYANFSAGLTTLAHIGNVPYVTVTDEKTLHGLHLALDRSPEEREKLFGRPIDTLVIDTIDGMQRSLMESRLQRDGRTETDVSDWGWIAQRLHKIFTKLSELDIHILILSHLKEVPVGEDTVFKPALGGAFADGVFEYVNHAALLSAFKEVEAKEVEVVPPQDDNDDGEYMLLVKDTLARRLQTWPSTHYQWIHDKTNTLPPHIDVTPDVFAVISDYVAGVTIDPSSVVTIDPSTPPELETATQEEPQVEEPAESPSDSPEQVTEELKAETFKCEGCGTGFDTKAWADLSKMRHGRTLCGECFKTA